MLQCFAWVGTNGMIVLYLNERNYVFGIVGLRMNIYIYICIYMYIYIIYIYICVCVCCTCGERIITHHYSIVNNYYCNGM